MGEAGAWMRAQFGADWEMHVHHTHTLMVAEPLLYCSECARFAAGRRHLRSLLTRCEPPRRNTTYFAYKRYLREGKHPSHLSQGPMLHDRPVRVYSLGGREIDALDPEIMAPLRKAQRRS